MTPAPKKYIRLRTHDGEHHQAYVELIDHPHEPIRCVYHTVRVHNLIEGYDGPGIAIDFDKSNRAIGIEILYPYGDDEDGSDAEE